MRNGDYSQFITCCFCCCFSLQGEKSFLFSSIWFIPWGRQASMNFQHGSFPGAAVLHGLLQPRFLSTGCSPAPGLVPLWIASCQPSCSSVGSFLQSFLPEACSSMAFPFPFQEKPLLEPPEQLAMQTKHRWHVEAFRIRVTAETAAWQMKSSLIVSYMGTPGLYVPITSPSVAKGLSHAERPSGCPHLRNTL